MATALALRARTKSHIAAVIARSFLLLIAAVVLFVNNDEAEILHWREDARAGANDDARLATLNATPLIGAFGIAESGMQNGHLLAEALKKLSRHSGRESDFGNQAARRSCRAPKPLRCCAYRLRFCRNR